MDNIIINKIQAIETALARVREEYANNPLNLRQSQTRCDSILLNLQRACESAIDLAMHVVRIRQLGLPQSSRDAFVLLARGATITDSLSQRLQAMVGFRNIAIHQYQQLNLDLVQSVIETRLLDFEEFCAACRALLK